MPIRPPPSCRIFSDGYVSQATFTLGMFLRSFDPSPMTVRKHFILHSAEVEASILFVTCICFAIFAPTENSHVVGRNHPLM
jgi:hypothetical protein